MPIHQLNNVVLIENFRIVRWNATWTLYKGKPLHDLDFRVNVWKSIGISLLYFFKGKLLLVFIFNLIDFTEAPWAYFFDDMVVE